MSVFGRILCVAVLLGAACGSSSEPEASPTAATVAVETDSTTAAAPTTTEAPTTTVQSTTTAPPTTRVPPTTTEAPTTSTDPWGTKVTTPMEVLYAADVPSHVKTLLEEALTAATNEWGNYGPLEYWVAGTDVPAATDLADQFCTRRISRGQGRFPSKEICMTREHVATFLPAQAAEAAERIAAGYGGGSAGLNGMRGWGIHLLSSSYPLCFDDGSRCAYQEDQGTALHEYFHVVQHAHISTFSRNERDALLGGVWFNEGGAEFMAQTTAQRLRDSGTLTASTWNSTTRRSSASDLATRMEWKMNKVKERRTANPGLKISEIEYGPDQNIAYDYGTWAHAYLADMVGPDVLLDSFYANLNDLGWEESFVQAYGMTSAAFLTAFEEFLDLPIGDQLQILP